MDFATIILLALLSPLLLINLLFLLELFAGLGALGDDPLETAPAGATIIIPAHNEAAVIGRTLTGLTAAAGTEFPILVVADNCSDGTASIARSFGVHVLERNDTGRRGKGFALSFARDWLKQAPPEAVVVLDADCRTDLRSLRALAAASLTAQRPAQAINLLEPCPSGSAMVQVSTFAFMVKNKVRQRGLQRLTGGVHLTGTGMCLPWPLFADADLATPSIVEDIRLGMELSRRGRSAQLVEASLVWSPHAAHEATIAQRQRWEGGFLALARIAAPRLIRAGVMRRRVRTIIGGLDFLVPPLALLVLVNAVAALLALCLPLLGVTGWVPFSALIAVGALAMIALTTVWWREGRVFLSAGALARLPAYVVWKIPMYLGLARKGAPSEWRRTDRPGETDR